MKEIYLIRHSGPFVNLYNYEKQPFEERNKNMILSSVGERKAKELISIEELHNLDEVYSSNSARAIATAKYISEINNLEIKIDNRINERKFGVTYIEELPDNFFKKQLDNENYKLENGESLKEVKDRFKNFLNEILKSNNQKTALFIHGVLLMAYLSTISKVEFNNDKFKVTFNDKEVMSGIMKNPDVYKITYDDNLNVIDIVNII